MREKITFNANYGTKANSSLIKVIGVGGGGGNAVKHMYTDGIVGVDFLICNTDRQALENNHVPSKLVLGESGLGAGANPAVARELAVNSKEKIRTFLGEETRMLFITAGMGKGTGTGAAPVVAEIAKEMGILTIGVVTYPFDFEGANRQLQAAQGIEELKKHVDSLLIIKNQNIMKYYSDATLSTGFAHADDVLKNAVKCIAELITVHADQNVDFNDIETVMKNSGEAMLGLAEAEGENRIDEVVEKVFTSPLLNDGNIVTNAKNFLFFVTYGKEDELRISELDLLTQKFKDHINKDSSVIWGRAMDESLGKAVKLSLIITNFKTDEELKRTPEPEKTGTIHENDLFNSPFSEPKPNENQVSDPFANFMSPTQPSQPSQHNSDFPKNSNEESWKTPTNQANSDNNQANRSTYSQAMPTQNGPQMINNNSGTNYKDADIFEELYTTPSLFREATKQTTVQIETAEFQQPNLQIQDDSHDFFFKNIPD